MRRPFGVEITPEDRATAREWLRNPLMQWESPEAARDFYAARISDAVLRDRKPAGHWLYAFALAARLADVQTRKDFPPRKLFRI